jgi:hypothetical protein
MSFAEKHVWATGNISTFFIKQRIWTTGMGLCFFSQHIWTIAMGSS